MLDSDEPIPISLVAHTVFCPRRAWLENVGEKVASAQIEAGVVAHGRVDDPGESRGIVRHAVDVHHVGLGISGRCDVLREGVAGVEIVEFKTSPVRRRAEVTEAQRVQVALQALCLESMGQTVVGGSVYFVNHNVSVAVPLGESDLAAAREWVAATRTVVGAAKAPPPLLDDPRCRSCSHTSVCLPDELRAAQPARRISVSDPDGEILHISTQGARASLRSGRVQVVRGEDRLSSLPLERVRGIVVHGNVDVSGALLREMMWRRLSVVWCSGRGRVVGWSQTAESPNGQARVQQHVLSHHGSLDIATELVAAKVSNQATLLRRNGDAEGILGRMREISRACQSAQSLPELYGLEGEAAGLYFTRFHTMVRQAEWAIQEWQGRAGRAATDPLNAALNYTYGLLLSDTIRAVVACGLDPVAGFLHSSGRNKPALALDLMEEFRAVVADSSVIRALNNGELRQDDFSRLMGGVRLSERGRKSLIAAYERRVNTTVQHPTFGYKLTWRRAIEVQARLVLGVLDGSHQRYRGMRVR